MGKKDVDISPHFGIVIRRDALLERGVRLETIVAVMDSPPRAENPKLLSFGPHFGGEAANEFARRLEDVGLIQVDDFFVFEGLYPPWIRFFGQFSKPTVR